MSSQEFRVEPLSHKHDRSVFSSGAEALDRYLRDHAGQDQRRRLSTIFILVDVANGALAGFYTLAASAIEPSCLPEQMAPRRPPRSRSSAGSPSIADTAAANWAGGCLPTH